MKNKYVLHEMQAKLGVLFVDVQGKTSSGPTAMLESGSGLNLFKVFFYMKVFDFVRQMVFPGFRERSQVERICSEEAKDEERPFPGHKGVQGMACHSPETYSSMVLLP